MDPSKHSFCKSPIKDQALKQVLKLRQHTLSIRDLSYRHQYASLKYSNTQKINFDRFQRNVDGRAIQSIYKDKDANKQDSLKILGNDHRQLEKLKILSEIKKDHGTPPRDFPTNHYNFRASIPEIQINSYSKSPYTQAQSQMKLKQFRQSNQQKWRIRDQQTQRIPNYNAKTQTHQHLAQAQTQRVNLPNQNKYQTKKKFQSAYQSTTKLNDTNKIDSIIQVLSIRNRPDLIEILQTFYRLAKFSFDQDNKQNQQNYSQKNPNEQNIQQIILEIDQKINSFAAKNTKFQHFTKLFALKQKRMTNKIQHDFQEKMNFQLSQYQVQLAQIVQPLLKLKSTIEELSQQQTKQEFCEKTKEIKQSRILQNKLQQVERIDISLIEKDSKKGENTYINQLNSPQNTIDKQTGDESKNQNCQKVSKWKLRLQNLLSSIKNKTYTKRQHYNSAESNDAKAIIGMINQNKEQSNQSKQKQQMNGKMGVQSAKKLDIKPFQIDSESNRSNSMNAINGSNIISTLIPDGMKTLNNIYNRFKFVYRFLLEVLYYEQNIIFMGKHSSRACKSKYKQAFKQELDGIYSNFCKIKVQIYSQREQNRKLSDNHNLHLLYTQIQSLNLFTHKCAFKIPEVRKLWKNSIKSQGVIMVQTLDIVQEQADKENINTSNIQIEKVPNACLRK